MVVAVNHQFGAVAHDELLEIARIGQAAAKFRAALGWRMMDHHHAHQAASAGIVQQLGQSVALRLPEAAGRQQRQGRNAGGQTNQSDIAAHPQKGKSRVVFGVASDRAYAPMSNLSSFAGSTDSSSGWSANAQA